jgi:hypothetical protein
MSHWRQVARLWLLFANFTRLMVAQIGLETSIGVKCLKVSKCIYERSKPTCIYEYWGELGDGSAIDAVDIGRSLVISSHPDEGVSCIESMRQD